jgi:hypothetical protein
MEKSALTIDWYRLLALAYENHVGGLVNRMIDLGMIEGYPLDDRGKMEELADKGWNEFCLSLDELGIRFDDSHLQGQ